MKKLIALILVPFSLLAADYEYSESYLHGGWIHQTIDTNAAITSVVVNVGTIGGTNATISFDNTLSGAEQTALDAVIAAHPADHDAVWEIIKPAEESLDASLIPSHGDVSLGTTNNPLKEVCVSGESVKIDGQAININSNGVLELPSCEFRSPGFTSRGRGRFRGDDVETIDIDRGMMSKTSNETWGVSTWRFAILQTDSNAASPILIKAASSPEIPFEEWKANANAERVKRIGARNRAISEMKANPNSVPALRAVVRNLMEAVGMEID